MKMHKFVSSVLVAVMISTTFQVSAQEIPESPRFELVEPTMSVGAPPSNIGALQTLLSEGQRAPFAGILLNNEALSWIMTNFVFVQRNLIEEMNRRVGITRLWARTNIETINVSREADQQAFQVQLNMANSGRDRALEELERVSRDVGWSRREKFTLVLSLIGTLVIGSLIGWGLSKLP